KVVNAICKAGAATGEFSEDEAKKIAYEIIKVLNRKFDGHTTPDVEQVQDIVEIILIQENWYKTAKAYILYREEHKKIRETKALIGIIDDVGMSVPALEVLKRRYLL
ncbi:MAG: ATP cone domain-containing protein, partial [Candidatus Absconditabacterales bacterium]